MLLYDACHVRKPLGGCSFSKPTSYQSTLLHLTVCGPQKWARPSCSSGEACHIGSQTVIQVSTGKGSDVCGQAGPCHQEARVQNTKPLEIWQITGLVFCTGHCGIAAWTIRQIRMPCHDGAWAHASHGVCPHAIRNSMALPSMQNAPRRHRPNCPPATGPDPAKPR